MIMLNMTEIHLLLLTFDAVIYNNMHVSTQINMLLIYLSLVIKVTLIF